MDSDNLEDILGRLSNSVNEMKLQLQSGTQNQAAARPVATPMSTDDFMNYLLLGIAGAAVIGAIR
jgi:hypothetical protein